MVEILYSSSKLYSGTAANQNAKVYMNDTTLYAPVVTLPTQIT